MSDLASWTFKLAQQNQELLDAEEEANRRLEQVRCDASTRYADVPALRRHRCLLCPLPLFPPFIRVCSSRVALKSTYLLRGLHSSFEPTSTSTCSFLPAFRPTHINLPPPPPPLVNPIRKSLRLAETVNPAESRPASIPTLVHRRRLAASSRL